MKKFVLFLVPFFLIHCSPYEQKFLSSFEITQEESSKELAYYSNREGSEEYINHFSSDKLDLIFILDSQVGMQTFYKKKIFGSHFLKRFENYDWRLAYTNMGVNPEFVKKQNNSCGLTGGIISSLFGIVVESPFLLTNGVQKLSNCFSSKKEGANGRFLPFEHKGKAVKSALPYLTRNHPDYQAVFDSTFQTIKKGKKSHSYGKRREEKRVRNVKFDAPQTQKGESYPLTSLILSLFNNPENFFREDSQVVYVLITPQDAENNISAETIREQFDHSYKNGERLHIISAVVKEEFPACLTYMENLGVSSARVGSKIMELSNDMDADIINICSQHFGEQLAVGIKKYLHPTLSL